MFYYYLISQYNKWQRPSKLQLCTELCTNQKICSSADEPVGKILVSALMSMDTVLRRDLTKPNEEITVC